MYARSFDRFASDGTLESMAAHVFAVDSQFDAIRFANMNMSVSTSGKRNRDDMQTQQSSNITTEKETGLDTILHTIKSRISSIVHEKEEQITVCVSGMASIYAALKCVQELGRQSGNTMGGIVVFGFPYLDTLKVRRVMKRYEGEERERKRK